MSFLSPPYGWRTHNMQPNQREVLRALIGDENRPLLRRFDGTLFNPNLVLEEIEHHYRATLQCFQSDGSECDAKSEGPGRFRFWKFGWLQPVVPGLLTLPEGHDARLNATNSRVLANSIAHVDQLFLPIQYEGQWWLYLKDPVEMPRLIACDYYILRRVLAFEELQAALDEEEADMEAPTSDEVFHLHVWGQSFTSESYGKPN